MTAQQKVLHKPELQEVVKGTLKRRELEGPAHALIRSYPHILVGQMIRLTVHPLVRCKRIRRHECVVAPSQKRLVIIIFSAPG
ncbi:hypothetical protein QFZ84_005609 [Pseudomonas fluorescens]